MNSSLWTYHEVPVPSELTVLPVIIIILIIVTNLLILLTFKRIKKLQLQQYLMVCLAVVDMLTVLPHLSGVVGFCRGYLYLTDSLCKMLTVTNHSLIAATTWIHCAICIDKCCSVLKPLEHKVFMTRYDPPKIAIGFSIIAFSIILAIIAPSILSGFVKAVFDQSVSSCMLRVDAHFFCVIGTILIFAPLIIVLVTHVVILNKIRKSSTRRRRSIKRAMKTVALTVGIYYLCWTPIIVNITWWALPMFDSEPPLMLEFMCSYLIVANSAMNFFIYVMTIRDFNRQFRAMFHIKLNIQPYH